MNEKEINKLADSLAAMAAEIRKAQEIAFDLAKAEKREALLQLRGAFGGTAEAARELEGFLTTVNRLMGNLH